MSYRVDQTPSVKYTAFIVCDACGAAHKRGSWYPEHIDGCETDNGATPRGWARIVKGRVEVAERKYYGDLCHDEAHAGAQVICAACYTKAVESLVTKVTPRAPEPQAPKAAPKYKWRGEEE